MIDRTFQKVPDGKITEADQRSFLVSLGWSRGITWDTLLKSKRILLISEAGAGKTYECRAQSALLNAQGAASFLIELSALTDDRLSDLLSPEELARLNNWLSSQSDIATFFLDSIDELKLTQTSFEKALNKFKNGIQNQLHKVRLVITTRPIPYDEQLIRRQLPVPQLPSTELREDTFAKIALNDQSGNRSDRTKDDVPDWRTVALMPLSESQILEFAKTQGVNDPDALLKDLRHRHAQDFARRPQDLIELCADWREHKRIRTHREQVETSVRVKLLPREDRKEPAELSIDKAIEGASRLALAMQVTRRLTVRHSAASDAVTGTAAVDPAVLLSDWPPNERKALLERSLFGFASYGRVRFHHPSVPEYLAAERLLQLHRRGMSFRALKRLIFADTRGNIVVRPSKRPIAGWLASHGAMFELLRDNDPSVLFDEGDPESLSPSQRNQVLRAFVERYGNGGWQGLQVPQIQVQRFATKELASEITRIWREGVENPDVREILLSLVEAARIKDCADIAHDVAIDAKAFTVERMTALDALIAIQDERLSDISVSIAARDERWPERVARGAVLRLFPKFLTSDQLCQTLRWIPHEDHDTGDLHWQLPRLIEDAELNGSALTTLRDGLLNLCTEGMTWRQQGWPHLQSDRPHLSTALAATCERGLAVSRSAEWLRASVVALRLHSRDTGNDGAIKSLRKCLRELDADDNARLFWAEDALLQSLRGPKTARGRLSDLVFLESVVHLTPARDYKWVSEALADKQRDSDERSLLLEAALQLSSQGADWRVHANRQRQLVIDRSDLLARIDEFVKPSSQEDHHLKWEKQEARRKRKAEKQRAKDHASWVNFWREIADQPESVFTQDRSDKTVWALWQAMRHAGDESRSSGWNRRFIEELFDKKTADRLRQVLMTIWRRERPTLPSERPEQERNTYLVRWQLGLAALYAEAEDANWAQKLTAEEASLAARFALIELNGLPPWVKSLATAHPNASAGHRSHTPSGRC